MKGVVMQKPPAAPLRHCPCVAPLRWMPVPGGICRFGDTARPRPVADLLVAVTPLTYGQLGRAGDDMVDRDLPVTGIDHDAASRCAALVGGRLPCSVEWEWLVAGP